MTKPYYKKLKEFSYNGNTQSIEFIECLEVTEGVFCDVYKFTDDETKDLGIITVLEGFKTPRQKVLNGDKTIEGFISGKGTLFIEKPNNKFSTYIGFSENPDLPTEVKIGEIMQWKADKGIDLVAFEICFPPYKDGRYENLAE